MKLKSAVFINALTVAFKQIKTKMTVAEISRAKVTADSGNFLLFAEFGNGVNAVDDGVGGVDGAVFHFFKNLTNSASLAEDAVLAFNKALSETIGAAEAHLISYGKPLGDSAAITDVISKEFPRSFTDSAAVTDVLSKGFPREFTETPALTDTNILGLGKNFSETPALTDAINTRALTKALTSLVNTTDDVDGEASILDDQEMQFVKNTTNVATITDSIALTSAFSRAFADSFGVTDGDVLDFGKRPSDTIPITDAGSLRSQGYSDFTYFEEDYVGASRTF